MKIFEPLKSLILLATSLLPLISAQGHLIPLSPETPIPHHKREIANLTFYTLSFNTPGPIIRFESTLIIPPGSRPNESPTGALNAIWPGLLEVDLLQNVLTNQKLTAGNKPAQWFHLPFFCCNKAGNISEEVQVWQGDALTSLYVWDGSRNLWLDSWVLASAGGALGGSSGVNETNGRSGEGVERKGFQGNLVYDSKRGGGDGKYTHAILAIELQGLGKWDWGAFTWRNVIVQARTNETTWCTKFSSSKLKFHTSPPVATTDGELTTCYIGTVVFEGPDENPKN